MTAAPQSTMSIVSDEGLRPRRPSWKIVSMFQTTAMIVFCISIRVRDATFAEGSTFPMSAPGNCLRVDTFDRSVSTG